MLNKVLRILGIIFIILLISLGVFITSISIINARNKSLYRESIYTNHHTIELPQAKKDFRFFRQVLEINHPGIYRWHSKKEITALMDSVEGLLTKPVLDNDFYKYLSIVNNRIGCSHSEVYYNFRDKYFEGGSEFFPIPLVFINHSYYSTCSSCKVPRGSRIISINGHPMSEIAQKLQVFNSVDGNNDYISRATITTNFDLKYYFIFGGSESFQIKYEESLSGKIYKHEIEGVGIKLTYSAHWHPFWHNDFEYNFKVYDSLHTALFQLRTFSFGSTHQDAYDNFLENTFQLLSLKPNIKNLVIDLRNNGGGENENCYRLYSYLTDNDFYEDSVAIISKRQFSDHFWGWGIESEVLDSIKKANYIPLENTDKLILSQNAQKKWKKRKNAFKGNVFVITNYATASAAIRLSSLLKLNENAIIIGEPTNGSYCSSNAYYTEGHEFEGHGISFEIPLVYCRYNLKKYPYPESSPLVPDYFVPLTIPDFINDKDTQFDFITKHLIIR